MTQIISSPEQLPSMIVHADWSVDQRKRCMARAVRTGEKEYRAYPPEPVGELDAFLPGLEVEAGSEGCVLVGFDFPIGLPLAYAQAVGVDNFLELLPRLGAGLWHEFFAIADQLEQISLYRPFYPQKPGSARREHLERALDLPFIRLFRQCELKNERRRAACPLFWTLGGQQVGKAALNGWQQVLIPSLKEKSLNLGLWPFHGTLSPLLQPGMMVVLETYPGEFYHHLGLTFPRLGGERGGKRSQAGRAANAHRLLAWAAGADISLEPELEGSVQDGFGSRPDGEDRFDAVVGLLGMLNLVLGFRPFFEPQTTVLRNIEGWIFGQEINPVGKGILEVTPS